jgi:DNA-binding NtrC family response regulator
VPTAPQSLASLLDTYPVLRASLRGIERAAASEAPVLILGEAGSGRSSLARALHDASRRAAGPLVELDPGALPSALFESELFGHRAGAFTGAAAASEGRVARAAGGSLVLDHVEELPLASQPKLLRVLSERRYAPLGGTETEALARFVAIGPPDLPQRVTQGAFRADLYYRLEVLAFRLPALRERRQDLPLLLEAMLADLGERFGRPGLTLAPQARTWMLAHSWPGNLRQLRNALERGVILSGPPPPPHLPNPANPADPADPADPANPANPANPASGGAAKAIISPPPIPDAGPLDPGAANAAPAGGPPAPPRTLLEIEQDQIRAALAYCRGHQGRAAAVLGISRKALWEKRRRYGIP